MQTNIIETLKATYENRENIADWSVAGNYAKVAGVILVLLCLLNMEHAVNLFPMARPIFTLIGLGVLVRYCSTKQGRATTRQWLSDQVERFL